MHPRELTKRQRQILDFITSEVKKKGYPPAVREIGAAVGLSSSSTVHSHLAALERKGYIRRDPSKPRAIELTELSGAVPSGNARSVALVGTVAAGQPILAAQNVEDTMVLPAGLAGDNSFLLRIKGDSMIEAGILDGDLLLVRQQSTADNGDIVVALLGEEATVKRFYRENGQVRLQPENRSMEPIYARDVSIVGRGIAVIRKL